MTNNIENKKVTVLLVSDNESDVHEVKKHIEKTMGLSCRVWYCSSIIRSAGFFKKEVPEVDIILLDLNLISSGSPREIFRQMQHIVGGIPIIVFTERADHELALLVIEEGAADNVTRGQFSTDPYKLRDAIEFSLARDKISKDGKQENAEALSRLGKKDAVLLRKQKEQGIADLKKAGEESATALNKIQETSTALIKEKDETIFWMGGGYSVNVSGQH